jgi:anti-sigma factor RsiW
VTVVEDLPCQQLVELVTDYFDDALAPDVRVRFEAHLETCEGCVEFVAQLRRTVETVGRLRVDDLDPDRRRQLLTLFRLFAGEPPS